MTDDAPLRFEAPLLCAAPCPAPELPRFLERLNGRLAAQGMRLHQSQCPIEGAALFSGRDFHLLLSPQDAPMPEVDTPHAAHIGVAVGDGALVKTPEMLDFEARFGIADVVRPANPAVKALVLHRAVLALLDVLSPAAEAILWQPMGRRMTPAEFQAVPQEDFPGALYLLPEAVVRAKGPDGTARLGFTTRGAAALIGFEIALAPAPLTLDEGMGVVSRLIDAQLAGRFALTSWGEARLSKAERVRLAPGPAGLIAATYIPPERVDSFEEEQAVPELLFAAADEVEAVEEAPAKARPALHADPEPETPELGAEPTTDRAAELAAELAAAPPAPPDMAGAERPAPVADGAAPLRRRAIRLIERAYNPHPAPGMVRHLGLGAALALVAPLPGFFLVIFTLLRGPGPRVALACAVLAAASVALEAGRYLFAGA